MNNKTPWYQRPLQAAVLAALIATILLRIVSSLAGVWWNPLTWGQKWSISVGVFLIVGLSYSVLNPLWRRGWVALFGLRINGRGFRGSLVDKGKRDALADVSTAQNALREEGRATALAEVEREKEKYADLGRSSALEELEAKRSSYVEQGRKEALEEVARERRAARKPVFRARLAPWPSMDDQDAFLLYNDGVAVTCVSVEAPIESWVAGPISGLTDTFTGESLRPGVAKQFMGTVMARGYTDGIKFTINYLDQNNDPQKQTAELAPDKLRRNQDERP